MKVLFLDIDGVMISYAEMAVWGSILSKTPNASQKINQTAKRFLELLVENGVKIVVTSSLRKILPGEKLTEFLGVPVHDRTPSYPFPSATRGDEVAHWIQNQTEEVQYCLVDDEDDYLEHQKKFLVRTNYKTGLNYPAMYKACQLLGMSVHELRKKKQS